MAYPAFPSTPLLDDFNRADGALGANYSAGAYAAASRIVSNRAVPVAGGAWSSRYWNPSTFKDCEAWVDLAVLPAGFKVELYLRAIAGANLNQYTCYITSGAVNIDKTIADVSTNIATASVSFAAGDKFGIRCLGNTLSGYRYIANAGGWDQTPVVSGTDTGSILTTATGNIAFALTDGGTGTVAIDNFGGGAASLEPPPHAALRVMN